ncbi:MAG: N-acetylmuramoyl-L-alanine amidase [Planctomycetota bacterium]
MHRFSILHLMPGFASVFVAATALLGQQPLFFANKNLTAHPRSHANVAAAIRHLCAGPTAAETRAGLRSHIPRGTRLLASARSGATLTLTFSEELLHAHRSGCDFEHAIEQIDKTALRAPGVNRIAMRIRYADGREQTLGQALGANQLPQLAQGSVQVATAVSSFGALAGRRIAMSPGHGYYWHSSLGWTTQRGEIDGLIEDIHTAQIANRYLIPLLENMGAEIVHCRETGETSVDGVADNDQGGALYAETGGWSTSVSSGYQNSTYRFANTNPSLETATATWTLPVQEAGLYPVFAWFRASGNRTPEAVYRVAHSGGTSEVIVDQTVDDRTWAHLGNFWFTPSSGASITLSNRSPSAGVVIADAMRLGGGLGSIVRGGSTSLQERWRECARYWAQYAGAPASVYNSSSSGQDNSDDVTARPRFAEWRTADAFVSLHTNAGGGTGTDTFIYSGGATSGSSQLSQAVHTQIIADVRGEWNAAWVDRGQKQANFGELRLLSTMPGILVELAFHDQAGTLDHRSLHDPEFRYVAARAYARGVLRYFAPLAAFPPEPPPALRIVQDGAAGLRVAWDIAPGATSYTIEQSTDGKGFVEVDSVTTTSWSSGPLPQHSWRTYRVRSWNATGRSFPSDVLSAGVDHRGTAQALLVQGFDRVDRFVKGPSNTRDYQHFVGNAVRENARFSLGFDAASNEAVRLNRVQLPDYDAVIWSLGEESTADETFDAIEQSQVAAYLSQGGSLLVHGAETGWDLDAQGSATDRSFYRNTLGTTYVADDANTYTLQAGLPGSVSAGTAATTFDDGSGATYDVNFADVLGITSSPALNGQPCLRYGNGLVAGVQVENTTTGARIVNLGLPIETITSADVRARLVQQSLAFLLGNRLTVRGPEQALLGQSTTLTLELPGEGGLPYIFGLSEGFDPGVTLPLGNLLPLNAGALLSASITPGSPLFVDFVGTLDAAGTASPILTVPFLPFLNGLELYFAGFSMPSGLALERRVSGWRKVRLAL